MHARAHRSLVAHPADLWKVGVSLQMTKAAEAHGTPFIRGPTGLTRRGEGGRGGGGGRGGRGVGGGGEGSRGGQGVTMSFILYKHMGAKASSTKNIQIF